MHPQNNQFKSLPKISQDVHVYDEVGNEVPFDISPEGVLEFFPHQCKFTVECESQGEVFEACVIETTLLL